jgi:hypothetical protein
MKPTFKRWITSSIRITAFAVAFAFFVSCADDELSADNRSQAGVAELPAGQTPDTFGALSGCDDNLTNDGCNFTSGEGRDHPNQYLMVDLMTPCRTEPLPANCTWAAGNITETRTIEVDLSNCCFPASSLNFQMNNWKAQAMSVRPSSSYLITNYERINGYMVTVYGPYRMVIRVTYRKKGLCTVVGERGDELPQ